MIPNLEKCQNRSESDPKPRPLSLRVRDQLSVAADSMPQRPDPDNQSFTPGPSVTASQRRAGAARRLLTFASHSGFGNQMISLSHALVLARLINRTVMLPPILKWHSNLFGPGCKGNVTTKHERLAPLALTVYQRRARDKDHAAGFDDVWNLGDDVVPFDAALTPAMDFSSHDPVCSGQLLNQSALHSLASRSERLVMVGSLYSGWWPTATPVPKQYSWNKSTFSSALFRTLGNFSCLYVRAQDDGNMTRAGRAQGHLDPVAVQVTRSINDSCCTHRNVYLSSNANATAICALLRKRPGCANVRCLTFSDLDVNNTHGEMLARFTPETRSMLLDVFACSHASIECKPADYHSSTFLKLIRASREGQLSEASAATSRTRSKLSGKPEVHNLSVFW